MEEALKTTTSEADETYQRVILQGVSRTFALTIPQLPDPLSRVVSNVYLLCRIADTIEDDKDMSFERKQEFSNQFINVVKGTDSSEKFAQLLYVELSPTSTSDERDLIKNTAAVIRITHSFNSRQRAALERCIKIMADGMTRYQATEVKNGLRDQADMDSYCYHVAGVVGEMLTELFCDYSKDIDKHHDQLKQFAVSFGQGLQMTNILKDIWEDQERGMCWLPRDVFKKYGSNLSGITHANAGDGFSQALGHLIGVAKAHLSIALRYTLLIPRHESGIRRFCLWALGMAVLTLRKINANRSYTNGQEVKITRTSVKATIVCTNLLTRHNSLLNILFHLTSKTLPHVKLTAEQAPVTEAN